MSSRWCHLREKQLRLTGMRYGFCDMQDKALYDLRYGICRISKMCSRL